jgi:hypothetical protein
MLVPLTDPNHLLAALMLETIHADRQRQLRAALREREDLDDEAATPAPRRHAWSRLASVERDPNGRRVIRIFRAPAPAI